MKQFFKFFFASCLGSAVMLLIVIIVLISMIDLSLSSKDKVSINPQSVLYMNLDYDIPDRTPDNSIDALNFKINDGDGSGMNDILTNIKAAADDPNISGILLELSSVGTSSAYISEIRNHLAEFKKSGKFVISYGEAYAQNAYYLGSVADRVYLNPEGVLDIHGMYSQVMFYKHLMEKIGVEMQIVRGPNNKFKSAVEPYFLDKMSEANREQYEKLLNSVWFQITSEICESRNISMERINEVADSLTVMFDANEALKNNFVDALIHRDQLIDELRLLTGTAHDKKINILSNADYSKAKPERQYHSDKIAVVYASGQIYDGEGDDTKIGGTTLSQAIREARNDKKVKAIVMRVNSPGGSALASAIIGREVALAAKEKPFIVSMGNYAASGGYWISTEADYIFADPTTLTGSIGVFGTIPNLKSLLNDKLGLTFDGVKTNKNSDFGNLTEPMSPYALSMMQKHVARTYDEFTSLVARTRNLRQSYVDSIGQGRVWSGADALGLGLVDELGGIEKAIAYAAEKAGLAEYSIKAFPKQKGFMSLLFGEGQEYYTKSYLKRSLGDNYSYIETLEKATELEGVQALMPFTIER